MTPEILVQTVPVGPRQSSLSAQWFAVIVAARLDALPPVPPQPSEVDELLLPWRWLDASPNRRFKWSSERPIEAYALVTTQNQWQAVEVELAEVADVRTPLIRIPRADIESWLRDPHVPLAEQYTLTGDIALANKELFHRQIVALATSWGAVPESLHLLKYCRVRPQRNIPDGTIARLAFLPNFGLSVDITPVENGVTRWTYKDENGVVANLRAAALELAVKADMPIAFDGEPISGAGLHLDFRSYWFRAELLAAPPPAADEVTAPGDPTNTIKRTEKSVPHPLVLRVLEPKHTLDVEGLDAWNKVGGVGLLLRRGPKEGGQPWLCMNGAMPASSSGAVLEAPTFAPLQLQLRSHSTQHPFVRDSMVEYAQEPLCAENLFPTGDADPGTIRKDSTIDGQPIDPRTKYPPKYSLQQNTLGQGDDRLLLHRLVYGETYYAAIFLADIAGGVPSELAGTKPWLLKKSAFAPPDCAITKPIDYRRRVGVGHALISPIIPSNTASARWPAVPQNVRPLYFAVGADRLASSAADTSLGGRAPVILPIGSTFDFYVRPPSTSKEVCERWAKNAGQLRKVLEDASAQGGVAELDDPATSGVLVVVEEGYFDAHSATWQWQIAPNVKPVHITAPAVHGRSAYSKVTILQANAAVVAVNQSTITLPMPSAASRIFRISVYVALADDAEQRFEVYRSEDNKVEVPYLAVEPVRVNGRKVLSPERFVVELASPVLPNQKQLGASLRLARRGRTVDIEIDPNASVPAFCAIDRFEVDRLEWVYQGVPRPRPGGDIEGWEREALAGLGESDVVSLSTLPVAYRALYQGKICTVATDDYSTDLHARHLKYRLRAYSRYEGLAKDGGPAYGEHGVPVETAPRPAEGPQQEGWVRSYLPYELPAPAAPAISAVIPLTRSPFDRAGDVACPLLVIVAQPPFAGGIDEEIECAVVRDSGVQAGRDPLVSVARADTTNWAGAQLVVEGPYGHSYDTDAPRPLYGLGSYLVHPPVDVARGWDMAQIRFRRTHLWFGEAQAAAERSSAWTEPRWVQFLPPHSFGGRLSASIDESRRVVTAVLNLDAGASMTEGAGRQFQYALLVTRTIRDYRNREVEQIADLVGAKFSTVRGIRFEGKLTAPLPKGACRVRVCELQLATDEESPADILDSLLNMSADDNDAGFRITRISPLITIA